MPGTVGLWCFAEGTGDLSINLSAAPDPAPSIQGIAPGDWVDGELGIRPADSLAEIPDHPTLNVPAPWRMDIAFRWEEGERSVLFERGDETFEGGAMNRWMLLQVMADGRLQCNYRNDAMGVEQSSFSAPGAIPLNSDTTAGCRRAADGDLTVFINGLPAEASTGGNGMSTTVVATDQPIDIGRTRCSTVTCPGAPNRFAGVIHAVRLVNEL
jgi:hypothetical protein